MPFALLTLLALTHSPSDDGGWEVAGRSDGVVVYTRHSAERAGEVLAVAVVDAPPAVAKVAIDDFDAKKGHMPFLKEAHVLSRDARGVLVYNRTSAPLVADRDYTLRVTDKSFKRTDGGMVYVTRFETANDLGPPPTPGVVRVQQSEGEWRFEPVEGGRRTRATYRVSLDLSSETQLPRKLLEWGSVHMMSKVIDALRERVRDPKYVHSPLVDAAPGTVGR